MQLDGEDTEDVATHPTEWDSICIPPGCMPRGWGEQILDAKLIKLKDTGSGYYKNVFIDSVTFKYILPNNQTDPVSTLIFNPKTHLHEWTVHLFKVQHGKDHFLGEYRIHKKHTKTKATESNHVFLKRLRTQLENVYTSSNDGKRSKSESKHESVIKSLFPNCGIEHEPECTSGLQRPCVIRGRQQAWSSDFYTVDYVTYDMKRGHRICWESKSDLKGLNDVAIDKCRALRDKGFHRVVAIVDHGEKLVLYDFGWSKESEEVFNLKNPQNILDFKARF